MDRDPLFYGRSTIEALLKRYAPSELPPKGKHHYHQGVCLSGVYEIYRLCGEERYFSYIRDWVDSVTDTDGSVLHYRPRALDDLQPGILLFPLWEKTGEKRYELCLKHLMEDIDAYPVNSEGGFWHAESRPDQMWLDSLYMACPLCAAYGKAYGQPRYIDKALLQVELMRKHCRDTETGLWYHAWDMRKEASWADKESGHSSEFWGRAIGWVLIAMLDILDSLEPHTDAHERLCGYIKELSEALCRYQSPQGRWYQLVNKGDRPGNWLENSCSCLYVAALSRAITKGILSESFLSSALRGYQGVIDSLCWQEGTLLIGDICIGTGVGDYLHYCRREKTVNDLHGIGAFLLMCAAIQPLQVDRTIKNEDIGE